MTDPHLPPPKPDLSAWWDGARARVMPGQLIRRQALLTRFFKIVLPAAALIVLAIAMLWPALLPRLPIDDWAESVTPELAMFDLTYRGTDEKGQPFTVSADKATRNLPLGIEPKDGEKPLIDLTAPQAAMALDGGVGAEIKANTGLYDETTQDLRLDGDVRMTRDDGLTVEAPDLAVDFEKNRAWTDKPVTASGEFGEISGQGLRLEDGGKTIIFTGQTKAQLNGAPEPSQNSSATTEKTIEKK